MSIIKYTCVLLLVAGTISGCASHTESTVPVATTPAVTTVHVTPAVVTY